MTDFHKAGGVPALLKVLSDSDFYGEGYAKHPAPTVARDNFPMVFSLKTRGLNPKFTLHSEHCADRNTAQNRCVADRLTLLQASQYLGILLLLLLFGFD